MSRITAAGTELQPLNGKLHFYVNGGLDDQPEVRGADFIVPSAAGRLVPTSGARLNDRLLVELRGFVHGIGATEAAAQQDYRSTMDTLLGIFDPTDNPWALVVFGPVHGVATGHKRTIMVRYLDSVPGELYGGITRNFSIRLECVTFPAWVDTSV
jgi:hypothetical protein